MRACRGLREGAKLGRRLRAGSNAAFLPEQQQVNPRRVRMRIDWPLLHWSSPVLRARILFWLVPARQVSGLIRGQTCIQIFQDQGRRLKRRAPVIILC